MKLRNYLKATLLTLTATTLVQAADKKFSSSDSVTININNGNSDLETYVLESKNNYQTEKRTYSLDAKYSYGKSSEEVTLDNWSALIGVEQVINKKLSAFLKQEFESDLVANIKFRSNSDIGLKYYFLKTDKNNLNFDIGYRYTSEEKSFSSDKESFNKGKVRITYKTNIDKKVKVETFYEYLPNFTESDDYQMNASISLITKTISFLSIKTSLDWKFDNKPAENQKKDDTALNLSFIADF